MEYSAVGSYEDEFRACRSPRQVDQVHGVDSKLPTGLECSFDVVEPPVDVYPPQKHRE
jgi:hypothetical protein